MRLPETDAYIAKSSDFAKPILEHIRELMHRAHPEITECIKWSAPFFEYKGIVAGIGAFKAHVSVNFWKGKLMQDHASLFNGTCDNHLMTTAKFTSIEEIDDDTLLAYIHEAIDLNEKGVKGPTKKPKEKQELVTPEDLAKALAGNESAAKEFEAFSYSKKKDYIDWLVSAKREATRQKRLDQAIEWIAEGKPRNWKYMKEYQ